MTTDDGREASADGLEPYIRARRDLLRLWRTRQRLLLIATARFPKSHPACHALGKVCGAFGPAKDRAEDSAHRYEEKGGLSFNRKIDGVHLPGARHWYNGIEIPADVLALDRTMILNEAEMAVFEDMGLQGRRFFESVAELPPYTDGVQLQRESRRFEECLARAKAQLKRASAASSSKAHTPQSLQL
ncbi:MAG: hypothetical protein CMJ62_06255 [Planctomycetaceae bacterium]|nr:hypothetical protein [Planctomycetaceae bacterium]